MIGHRFAFRREVCVLRGISRAEFEKDGQPRIEQAAKKAEGFTAAATDDPPEAV